MRFSFRTKISALLIAHALLFALHVPAQDAPQTRPRRVGTAPAPTQPANPPSNPPANTPDIAPDFDSDAETPRINAEPVMRIGLVTDARSVTISTDGRLLNASEGQARPAPFEVARVRIEPRTLPADKVEDASTIAAQQARARQADEGRQAGRAGTDESQAGSRNARRSPSNSTQTGAGNSSSNSSVRLSARTVAPVRGALVYTSGTAPLLSASAPLLFASDMEAQYPIKFNEKPYRGRLEVFANMRGTLTVVNVVPLEEYVRGVVANELSPGGYPAIEALKAQAVAARTYAVRNRGQFASEGFDLLPTTRSQVYGGRSTEHPLTDRAVAETHGRVATFKGQPINALYTSTCGGRTEDAEHIFGGEPVPYLRARECSIEAHAALDAFRLRTSRDPSNIRDAEHASSPRDAALLAINDFTLPSRVSDEWLSAAVTFEEVRALLSRVATLARQSAPLLTNDAVRAPAFSTALARALDGESRGDVLLDKTDVEYLLAFRDADDIPAAHRADVAQLLREGHLMLYPDATLRPRQPLSRARVLRAVSHALEARELLRLQKATTRPTDAGALVLRPATGRGADKTFNVSANAYLFRAFGDALHQMRELTLVGGEQVTFHTDRLGEVDYIEMRPALNGAASDRFSPYTNWTIALTPAEVSSRLARSAGRIGTLIDLRVRARGSSRRALDLEITGTNATAHVTGGRIRSALGLREQLFVIERRYDTEGRINRFIFTGRGWGHGVGMCQVGAYGLARMGLTYDKILKSYYTDISLTKLY